MCSCGAGFQTATFTVTTPAVDGGIPCDAADGDTRAQTCTLDACQPVLAGPKLPRVPGEPLLHTYMAYTLNDS
jgi:hypothetical protein